MGRDTPHVPPIFYASEPLLRCVYPRFVETVLHIISSILYNTSLRNPPILGLKIDVEFAI
jgi:hypothetical protein